METYPLPHTTLKGSRLILGCMGLGGSWDTQYTLTKADETQARAFIDTGLELGAVTAREKNANRARKLALN